MFRNLVLKLPSLKCSSEYAFSSTCRKRSFRSLSPIYRLQPSLSAATKRSASSSRTERIHSPVETREKPLARNLCFSKEYYGNNNRTEIKEIEWREKPSVTRENKDDNISYATSENVQFDTLEQYELEAARPRSTKSSDLIEAFSSRSKNIDRYFHLQPNQMKPYGSCENFYSPSLIRPTNSLKYPKKLRRQFSEEIDEPEANFSFDKTPTSRGHRRFSTSSLNTSMGRCLSTTKSCIAKEGHSTKDKSTDDCELKIPKFRMPSLKQPPMHEQYSKRNFAAHEDHWSTRHRALEFSPPSFQPFAERNVQEILKISTPAMRNNRIKQENQKGSVHYKSSYSDLIKQKLKEKEDSKLVLTNEVNSSNSSDKMCVGCVLKHSGKPNKMLDAFVSLPGRRFIATRSKSNILSNERPSVLESNKSCSIENEHKLDQKYYSKHTSKSKSSSKTKKAEKVREYNPECEDVCTPITKALEKMRQRRFAYEPDRCKDDDPTAHKVYLPSKVKLPVPPCTPRPEYRDCKKIDPCAVERADECLEIKPKQLPKLVPSKCECIDQPPPTIAPKLQKLNLKFEDPPKTVCRVPPCQTPRADDSNPYKHKPLKPYMPGECACVQPPPMTDVKLKRLPRCEPEEVCRPPRICPVIETCPPRADECYRITPKMLPPLLGPPCPCVEPPQPTMAPPIRRLDLNVPEPERVCPRPPPCDEVDRADKHMKPKRKKLPKFVPGDCPCEDKPMVDWNLKRLVCEDEVQECIVPDPCKAFPRADWGCWEYSQDVCEEVDEKCIDKTDKCVKPKVKPCRKKSICETGVGPLDYRNVSKRKFSISSSRSSFKLYQKMKSQNGSNSKQDCNVNNKKEFENQNSENPQSAMNFKRTLTLKAGTKKEPRSVIHLIKALNEFDKPTKNKHDHLLFKPKKTNKLDYDSILNTIASTSLKMEKKTSSLRNEALRKPKITVPSRAISTTEYLSKSESDKKKEKECEVKEKCKKLKPSIKSLMCKRSCPRYHVCPEVEQEHRPSCRKERVPVCCEKEEPPYSAFTDNLPDSIAPFTDTPQWTCNRRRYGFHPVYKKEYEPIDHKRRKSTLPLSADLPASNDSKIKELSTSHASSAARDEASKTNYLKEKSRLLSNKDNKSGNAQPISKGLLKRITRPNVSASHSRPLTTKIFQIHPPEVCKKPKEGKECKNKMIEPGTTPKISCITKDTCKAEERTCCFRTFKGAKAERKPPPFPAFSDCLDEEMEDILTECPLDREKYLRMQPRFMNPPPKPLLLKPPPPNQGKIDILKEQECIREKLCLNNEGLSQSCTDFGKPVPLLKPKKEEENADCQRMEELKRLGRWPPFTLKSNRRYSTAANVSNSKIRSYSTLGLNSIKDVVIEKSYDDGKRIYMRKYHALLKCADQSVLADNEEKLKKITQNTLPNLDKKIQAAKTENEQWRVQNVNVYDQIINKQSNFARKVRRYFSTYRIRRQNGYNGKHKRQSVIFSNRTISSYSPILRRKMKYFRGNRYYKCGNTKKTADREKCKIKSHKKECAKFTLKNCPPKEYREKCHKIPQAKDCAKPFSPYPAYSECKEHELIAPSCECGYEVERMIDLQPRFSILNEKPASMQEFPSQERIDRALGIEYYKCKHGIDDGGQTIGCEALGDCLQKMRKKKPNKQEACQKQEEQSSTTCEDAAFECILRDHKKSNSEQSEEATDSCEADRKKIEDLCVTECLKSIPCHLPEEEKYCICKANCAKLFEEGNSSPQDQSKQNDTDQEKCTSEPPKTNCSKRNEKHQDIKQQCIKKREKPVCKDMILKSPGLQARKSKSLTQLEKIWQKIVNYFKARPNCPQPGDYKKKILREKAEKAAVAAGVIVVDPKCLPPGILKIARAPKKDCKVCPNQDPCESKKSGTRSSSPESNRRQFSTGYQPSRKYSKSNSCENLDEINRILEDGEIKRSETLFKNMRKPIFDLHGEKDSVRSEELRMSLDMEMRNDVDLSQLCDKDHKYPKTYFGYSNIIPSRENILERAWRISIEAYEKQNYPRSFNLFNEFLSTVEKSVNTVEDLEKMKTENVLRELDKFLKNVDANSTKKKK